MGIKALRAPGAVLSSLRACFGENDQVHTNSREVWRENVLHGSMQEHAPSHCHNKNGS